MIQQVPVKHYLGRFSYETDPQQTYQKIAAKMHTVIESNGLNNGLNIEELLVRGTVGSNATLDRILSGGADRFG